jgi:hypothetical protein
VKLPDLSIDRIEVPTPSGVVRGRLASGLGAQFGKATGAIG